MTPYFSYDGVSIMACMSYRPTGGQRPLPAKISCPNHRLPNRRPVATRPTTNGTRGSRARRTWIWASWAWWSAIGPALFCWWSSPYRPSETADRVRAGWSSSPSLQPPSSSCPSSSSFFLCLREGIKKYINIYRTYIYILIGIYIE